MDIIGAGAHCYEEGFFRGALRFSTTFFATRVDTKRRE
ncbi:MAG: hypothetical protein KatS3mg109_0910 [Pirellulaceae bacterium]|nr:MAG: hypothetical protein KatS3mg109_0910 [Pirellulaceae bacterium]